MKKAEIICIGDELLIGQTINSNAAWMGQELNKIGIDVYQVSTISDDKNHIVNALNDALNRTKLVLITGGLGPTRDDITKYTLTEYFKSPLVRNEKVYNQVEKMLKKRSIQMNDLNRKQADVPENASIFINYAGTAPAMWFELNNKVVISMPGVPYEMKELMTKQILPSINRYFKTPVIIHRAIYGSVERFFGIILEHFKGHLPFWLAPTQIRVLTITDGQKEYAQNIVRELKKHNVRVELDTTSNHISAQIKHAQLQKIPWMLVIGQKEQDNNTITLRHVNGKQEFDLKLDDVIDKASTLTL